MKNYDAKDASLNIGGQKIYGFGDDKYYALSARLDRGGSVLVVRKRKARQCRRFLEYSHNVTI